MNLHQCTASVPWGSLSLEYWLHHHHQSFFLPCGVFFLLLACLAIFTLSTPRRLCNWHLTPQHWPQALMKNCGVCFLQYDLFIPTVDGGGLESTIPNQWSLTENATPMINLCVLLSPQCGEGGQGKGEGVQEKSKSIGFSLQLWFMSPFWLFFSTGSVDKGKLYFL